MTDAFRCEECDNSCWGTHECAFPSTASAIDDGSPSSPSRISCVGATVPGGVPLDAALLARWERRPWLCGTSTVEALIAEVRRLNAELESAVLYMNAGGKPPDALAGAVVGEEVSESSPDASTVGIAHGDSLTSPLAEEALSEGDRERTSGESESLSRRAEADSDGPSASSLSVEEGLAFLESVYMDDEYDAEERYGAALAVLRDAIEGYSASLTAHHEAAVRQETRASAAERRAEVAERELKKRGAADTFTDAMENLNALAVLGQRVREQRERAEVAEAALRELERVGKRCVEAAAEGSTKEARRMLRDAADSIFAAVRVLAEGNRHKPMRREANEYIRQ